MFKLSFAAKSLFMPLGHGALGLRQQFECKRCEITGGPRVGSDETLLV